MFSRSLCNLRRFSSALYLTGKSASEQFAVLRPVLDFDERMADPETLQENLNLRKYEVNLKQIKSYWDYYKLLEQQKLTLENSRAEIVNKILSLKKDPEQVDELEKLQVQGKMLKEELKTLKSGIYEVEDQAVHNILNLPNVIHRWTPAQEDYVVHSFKQKPTDLVRDHVEVAVAKSWLEFTNPSFCYLTGDAAVLELATLDRMQNILLDAEYVSFSNSDFTRSVVIEGCGADAREGFVLENIHSENTDSLNRLHLTGSLSLNSFMAYFSRNSIHPSYLPLNLFTVGQKYTAQPTRVPSLFNFCKETGIQVFLAIKQEDTTHDKQFEDVVSLIKLFYTSLNCHFRLVYVPAHQLHRSESLRLSIQMFSTKLQKYMEIGHCSMYDSYPSKRLLCSYSIDKVRKYPKIISGTILRFQPLLACMLENQDPNQDENMFTELLESYTS